eukprot:NODE_246_length_12992_cov_0.264407.p5 type:complete len:237 gc:universal NODE_246_length_12992_cov_0.264407:6380-5670(-)
MSQMINYTIQQHEDYNFHILDFNRKANTFNLEFCNQLHKILDGIDDSKKNIIITTSKNVYSAGLDLKHVLTDLTFIGDSYYPLCSRWLTLPYLTIAVINGPCIAGGMMFSLCHDLRFMSNGYMQMNEIHLPSPIAKGMVEIVKNKINNPQILRDVLLFGKKFKIDECFKYGMVDYTTTGLEDVLQQLKKGELLKVTVKAPKIYGLIKKSMNNDTIKTLTEHPGVVDMRLFLKYAKL